jgi:hypothetical protein
LNIPEGIYSYFVSCIDFYNNSNSTEIRELIITPPVINLENFSSDSLSCSEWKMFGRNLNNTRYAPCQEVSLTNPIVNNYTAGNEIITAAAVANGYVYFGSYDNKTYQLNATNISQLIASYTAGIGLNLHLQFLTATFT